MVVRNSGAPSPPFNLATARSSICTYKSKPIASMWPCCCRPSMFPAPRNSRSSAAIRNPAPSSLNSFIAANRRRAMSVSERSGGTSKYA